MGVFSPVGGESIICVDARPIEDNLRALDCYTKLQCEYGDEDKRSITIFSKVNWKFFAFDICGRIFVYNGQYKQVLPQQIYNHH